MFERSEPTVHELTQRYEQLYSRVRTELVDKRAALLEAHRASSRCASSSTSVPSTPTEVDRLQAEMVADAT